MKRRGAYVLVPEGLLRDGADFIDFSAEYVDYEASEAIVDGFKIAGSAATEIRISHFVVMPESGGLIYANEEGTPTLFEGSKDECLHWLREKQYVQMSPRTAPTLWFREFKLLI